MCVARLTGERKGIDRRWLESCSVSGCSNNPQRAEFVVMGRCLSPRVPLQWDGSWWTMAGVARTAGTHSATCCCGKGWKEGSGHLLDCRALSVGPPGCHGHSQTRWYCRALLMCRLKGRRRETTCFYPTDRFVPLPDRRFSGRLASSCRFEGDGVGRHLAAKLQHCRDHLLAVGDDLLGGEEKAIRTRVPQLDGEPGSPAHSVIGIDATG